MNIVYASNATKMVPVSLPLLRYAYTLSCEIVHMCSLTYSPLEIRWLITILEFHNKHFHNLFLKYHNGDNNNKVGWTKHVTCMW